MIKQSDTEVEVVSAAILNNGFDVAFIVPTETGMNKSIMDAYGSVRSFLKRNEIHDYEEQKQGPSNKRLIDVHFVTSKGVTDLKMSLYRPETKDGDPRIWIYGLKELAKAYNLLALISSGGQIFVVNCSKSSDLDAALDGLIPRPSLAVNPVAVELLGKLKAISVRALFQLRSKGILE